jgi:hypothetical protein
MKTIFHPLHNLLGEVYDKIYFTISNQVLSILAKHVVVMFNRAEVHYWADFGTLLGLVRDNGIIYADTDVDFTVIENDETIRKLDACCRRFHLWFSLRRDLNRRSYCAYFRLLPARADIYVNRFTSDGNLLIGCEGPFSNVSYDLVKRVVGKKWKGVEIKIPEKAAELLTYRYGADWHIRKRDHTGRLHSTYNPTNPEESSLRRRDSYW